MNKTLKYIFSATVCLTLAFLAYTGLSHGERAKSRQKQDSLTIEVYGKMLKSLNDSVKDLKDLKDIAKYDSAFHRAGNLCYDNGRYIESLRVLHLRLGLGTAHGQQIQLLQLDGQHRIGV